MTALANYNCFRSGFFFVIAAATFSAAFHPNLRPVKINETVLLTDQFRLDVNPYFDECNADADCPGGGSCITNQQTIGPITTVYKDCVGGSGNRQSAGCGPQNFYCERPFNAANNSQCQNNCRGGQPYYCRKTDNKVNNGSWLVYGQCVEGNPPPPEDEGAFDETLVDTVKKAAFSSNELGANSYVDECVSDEDCPGNGGRCVQNSTSFGGITTEFKECEGGNRQNAPPGLQNYYCQEFNATTNCPNTARNGLQYYCKKMGNKVKHGVWVVYGHCVQGSPTTY